MSAAVLTILGDASGARRAISELRAEYARASDAMGSAARRASQDRVRVEADEIRGARRELLALRNARVRALRDETRARQQAARERLREERAAARARERIEREETSAALRQLRATRQARERAHRDELRMRLRASAEQQRIGEREVRESARAEREKTRTVEREERQRTRVAEQEARRRERGRVRAERSREREGRQRDTRLGGAARAVLGGAVQFAGRMHGDLQDARHTAASRETELNNTLVQLVPAGADATEIADLRGEIQSGIRRERLDPDAAIAAIGEAQSFANALGGDTAGQRRAALRATLDDVRFAALIDPQHLTGLVRAGAVARHAGLGAGDSATLLRAFAGIGFQGSVETDEMISRGLPGLQEAWGAGTVGITDPQKLNERRLEIARDFAAQIQAQAASGRTVTVAATRSNTVRAALANTDRQNRLGEAYAARLGTMSPTQRAAFAETFSRGDDGRWTMTPSVIDTPSRAARFFGAMHDHDPTALRNFMGAHGAGGARQLLHTPDVSAIASYFPMTTNGAGQSVREYEYVDELRRSMITPAQEGTIRSVREAEDSRRLNADDEERLRALTDNTSGLRALSDAFAAWAARNPVSSSLLDTAGGVAGALLPTALFSSMARGLLGASPVAGALQGAKSVVGTVGRTAAQAGRGALGVLGSAAALVGLATGGAVLTYTGGNEGAGEAEAEGLRRARAGLPRVNPAGYAGTDPAALRDAVREGVVAALARSGGLQVDPRVVEHSIARGASSARQREGLP